MTVKNIFDKIGDKGFVRTQLILKQGGSTNLLNIDGQSCNPYLIAPDEVLPAKTDSFVYNSFTKTVEKFYTTEEIKPAGIYLVVATPSEFPKFILRKILDKELTENSEIVLECRKIYVPKSVGPECPVLHGKVIEAINRYDKRAHYQWEVSHNSKGNFVPIKSLQSSTVTQSHDGIYLILKGKFIFADPAHIRASERTFDIRFNDLAENRALLNKLNLSSMYIGSGKEAEYFATYFAAFHEKSPGMIREKLLTNPVIRILVESEETMDYIKKLKPPFLKSITK